MKLPVLWPDLPDQHYACHSCGRCCREFIVHLTAEDRRRIDGQGWAGRLGVAPYVAEGKSFVLNHGADGDCVFLDKQNRCRIHAEFGADEKPLACRIYPFTFETFDDRHRVGLRFDCPSVGRNAGPALAEQRGPVTGVIRQWEPVIRAITPGASPIDLAPGRPLSRREGAAIERHLDGWLKDTSTPIVDRLSGVADLADTLAAATLDKVRDERFEELVGLLVADLPNAVAEQRARPLPPPTEPQLRLFRQLVFAHSEHVTFTESRYGWVARFGARLDQLKRARRMRRGRGIVPRVAGRDAGRPFAELEQVVSMSPAAAPAVDALLTRYLRSRVQSGTICGPAHLGHDLIRGLRATMLAMACAGWLARYFAATESRSMCEFEDWVLAVGMIDRTATRSPGLRGTTARLRLNYLSADRGVARLLRRWLSDPNERGTT